MFFSKIRMAFDLRLTTFPAPESLLLVRHSTRTMGTPDSLRGGTYTSGSVRAFPFQRVVGAKCLLLAHHVISLPRSR
jgi:hypothetical protein